jgi:hypothetical protein
MSIPDLISPIIGWRVWRLDSDGLRSLNGEPWLPGRPLAARCMVFRSNKLVGTNSDRGSHRVPGFDCTCGIYCSKTFDHLRRGQFWQYGSVHGEVNVWGLSVEHEHGFRARLAYPKTLYLSSEMLPVKLKTFQARIEDLIAYGCDVFIDYKTSSVPLWCKQSGLDAATLDLLMSRSKEWYARRKHGQTIRPGDRIALLGRGIAVVKGVNEQYVHAVLWNRQMVTVHRNRILWDQENIRWEAAVQAIVG